jgi:SRSO17 transposase
MEEVARQYVKLGADWIEKLQRLFAHIGHRFGRVEMQQRAWEYLTGLLSPLERKNGWQPAEAAAHAAPYSMQHLLDRASWDADAVRETSSIMWLRNWVRPMAC